jgi:RNA polymerase sigma-70 factor (ECF subfamily)
MKARKLTRVIKRAIAGSPEDIEILLRMNAQTILYHVHRLIPDPTEAQDVSQQVAMKVIRNIGTLKSPHAFSAWLRKVIAWTCEKHLQSVSRHNGHQCELDPNISIVDEDKAVIPEAAFETADGWGRLYEHIRRLPQAQYETLVMRYYDEMSYRDIADAQGVSTGTVSRNISNAKKNLRSMITDEGHITHKTQRRRNDAQTWPSHESEQRDSSSIDDINKMWSAMGGGAVIAEAFKQHMASSVSATETDRFIEFCHQAIQTCLPPIGVAASTASANLSGKTSTFFATIGGKLLLGGLSICLTGTIIGATIYYNTRIPSEDSIKYVNTTSYAPHAEILFDGKGDGDSNINPSRMEIALQDETVQVSSWTITGEGGTIYRKGEGSVITDPSASLAPGAYLIEWELINERDVPARVSRDFIISR